MRARATIIVFLLAAGACGGDAGVTTPQAPSSTATPTTAPTTTSSAGDPEGTTTSSSAPASTSTSVGTTSTSPPTTPTEPAGPTLDDGRPSTFVAITTDYAAVEVDTATGELLTHIGQTGTAADLEDGGEMAANVLDSVWRYGPDRFLVSDCCEPAAGSIRVVERGTPLSIAGLESYHWYPGWWATPAPTGDRFALLNEALVVTAHGEETEYYSAWLPDLFGDWATTPVAWNRAGDTLYYIGQDDTGTRLNSVSLEFEEPEETAAALPWVESGWRPQGLSTQASGNMVTFLQRWEGVEMVETRAVVFDPAGTLVAEFAVGDGSTMGNYDPTGTFLIYVDGDDVVRWQGAGRSGTLGGDYYYASW